MQFNRFIFDNYLATAEGKKALAFFKDFENVLRERKQTAYFNFLNHIGILSVEKQQSDTELKQYSTLFDDFDFLRSYKEDEDLFQKSGIDGVIENEKKFIDEEIAFNNNYTERGYMTFVRGLSLIFYFSFSKLFFPYYFNMQFPKLENICKEFHIPLQQLPSKLKYKERLFYYFEICKAFYDFRQQYNLTPEEFCVFLYYFAPNCIEPFSITESLPEPSKVYICGASKEDSDWIKNYNENTLCCWEGNTNMLPGDIMLLYEVKPVAAIQSIWRCASVGFNDPFEYYFTRVWVNKMVRIPPVTLDDLRNDSVWKEKGLVKASMQGCAGTPCTKDEYDSFLKILEAKGLDTSVLPQLAYTGLPNNVELNIEKDVEEKLLEPLLKKLGYTEKYWVRQLPVRMGRGERNYPDYALFPKGTIGEETAKFLWEAKFTISNKRHLQNAFLQAKSYAMRLQSEGFGLVAKEGIWISFAKDSFLFDKIKSYSWADLENPDVFSEVKLSLKR